MRPVILRKPSWCPPWGQFVGMTIYPVILLAPGRPRSSLRHELIHCHQVRRDGWFGFYGRYVLRWLQGVRYHDQPAEREAYAHEHDATYLPPDLEALIMRWPETA